MQFFDRVEAQSSFPNTIRIINLIVYILIIIHWNACFFILLSAWIGFGSDVFVYYSIDPVLYPVNATFSRMYLYAFFWSTLAMTTIADLPLPITDAEYAFIIVDFMLGVFIFATIVGKVGSASCRALFREISYLKTLGILTVHRSPSIHLFRHFCYRMYRLGTMHSVADRKTDRRQYYANSRLYCLQYTIG